VRRSAGIARRTRSRCANSPIARSLEISADALYAEAGIEPVPEPAASDVRQALQSDPALTSRQRRALLEVYDGLVRLNQLRRSPEE
jgi:hypothetical protein